MKGWFAVPLLVTALVTGCSQTPSYQLSDAERAKYSQSSPEELIGSTETRLKQAEKDELPTWAPVSFQQARAAFEEAVKRQQKRGEMEELITHVAAANNRLDRGYQNMEKARALLAPNLAIDKRLLELQAPKMAAAEYKDLRADLNAIIDLVDRGDDAKAGKSRVNLASAQQALKTRLVKAQALAELKALHAKIEADSDAKVVPVAVKEAVTAYKNLDGFIDAHADDDAAIATNVRDATVLAQRARWMAARARVLAKIDNDSTDAEKILADEEKWLAVIAAAVGGETVRHLPPDQQAARLAERIRELGGKGAQPASMPSTTPAEAPAAN